MKILLFGGSGQLGFEVQKRARDLNFEVVSPVTSEVNITDGDQVKYLAATIKPSVILNCAAYTAVDKAEQEPEVAFAVNSGGARHAAEAAEACGARLIHISTDYVFGGAGAKAGSFKPIPESQPVSPVNVYGQSKYDGEQSALKACERTLVLRTSSLYGFRGVNFVGSMLKLFNEKGNVRVVNDQYMSPTWAGWLAEVVLDLCRIPCNGVVHACNAGSVTWFEFAEEILKLARHTLPNGERASVSPISAAEFGRPAKRPDYSVLDCSKLASILGREPMSWKDGLKGYLHDAHIL